VGGCVLLPCDLPNFMGDAMNPLSPNQILRNLENGFFMTHKEQEETAQYIRQLQQENLTLLGKPWVGLTEDEVFEFLSDGVDGREDINNIEEALRSKNT